MVLKKKIRACFVKKTCEIDGVQGNPRRLQKGSWQTNLANQLCSTVDSTGIKIIMAYY
jgi:hypothetical protein